MLEKQGKEIFRCCIRKVEKEIISKNLVVSKEENETIKNKLIGIKIQRIYHVPIKQGSRPSLENILIDRN